MLISLPRNEFTSVLANMFTKCVNEAHIYSLPLSPRLPAVLDGGMDAAVVVTVVDAAVVVGVSSFSAYTISVSFQH